MIRLLGIAVLLAALSACTDNQGRPLTFFSILPTSPMEMTGPVNQPPAGWKSEFWIDRNGCTFVATESGDWVPQLNLDRTRKCDPDLAWVPIDFSKEPTSFPTPSESVDPVTGVVTRILPPQPIPPSFVQVAYFDERTNGMAARKQFIDMGFPVVGADATPPKGSSMSLVLGPFTEAGLLEDGLETSIQLGYEDAYTFQN